MSKISVLMPVYNTKEEYLREAVESILNQTFSDFELIIVDDGSDKDITEFIHSFNDNRIKFFRNERNIGVSETRNRLLNMAQGKYTAFQDSDDIAYPERLEKQAKFLDEHPEISAVGSLLECFPHKKIFQMPENPKFVDLLCGAILSQPTAMLRLEDFRKYGLHYNPDLRTAEDYEFFSRAMEHLKFYNIQEPLIKYRMSQNSLYHKTNKQAYKTEKEIKAKFLGFLTDDIVLQKKIMKTITDYHKKKSGLFEKLFAVRNEWYGDEKYKILTILGLKIKLKKYKEI